MDRFLAGLVASDGLASAAVATVVGANGRAIVEASAGWRRAADRPVAAGDRFDVASLTKPHVATLALRLAARGALELATPIGELFPRAAPALARRTLEDLLRHRSGLRAWTPLYRRLRRGAGFGDRLAALLAGGELLGAAPGTYSDLGYVLWGLAAERALGRPLSALLAAEVIVPLGLAGTGPRPRGADVVETRIDNQREVELAAEQGIRVAPRRERRVGQPHDANARFLGGLAAHAGLFAPAADLARLGRAWLSPRGYLPPAAVERALAGDGPYALGWARQSDSGSSGAALPREAFGHTAFTGASLWIDPRRRRIHVLAAHRRSSTSDFNRARREFHRLAGELG